MDATIIFEDQDHTLGNLLREALLKDPNVYFAAYKVPHPLENKMEVRVQGTNDKVVDTAIANLLGDIDNFERAIKSLKC